MVATAALALTGCSAGEQSSTTASKSTAEPPGTVSKADFEAAGKRWPLTVEKGVVGCTGFAYWFETGGKRYALNGTAQGEYELIEPIWQWDEKLLAEVRAALPPEQRAEVLPVRVSIGPLIDAADDICTEDGD